jgi:hypothetical protein
VSLHLLRRPHISSPGPLRFLPSAHCVGHLQFTARSPLGVCPPRLSCLESDLAVRESEGTSVVV